MNIEKQLKEFYLLLDIRQPSTNAISLYFVIVEIVSVSGCENNLSIANNVLISKTRLTKKEFETARNELINKKLIEYYKGKNQNIAPKYSVIKLYKEQENEKGEAEGMTEGIAKGTAEDIPERVAEDTTEGILNTKLNLFYLFINNNITAYAHAIIEEKDKKSITNILKRLDIYCEKEDLPDSLKEKIKIEYWAIKELHFSPYKSYMEKLNYAVMHEKYEKTQIFMLENEFEDLYIFLNYYIKCLQTFLTGGDHICKN